MGMSCMVVYCTDTCAAFCPSALAGVLLLVSKLVVIRTGEEPEHVVTPDTLGTMLSSCSANRQTFVVSVAVVLLVAAYDPATRAALSVEINACA